MFGEDVIEDLGVDESVAQVLPYFIKLKENPPESVLREIKQLADDGNIYACYVYGIYNLFGKLPRYYSFNKDYPEGSVRESANIALNERLGLSYLVELFKIKNQTIREFHLEGLYDLHKIVDGKSLFFTSNDIACRPKSMSDPFYPLFANTDKIRAFLRKLDHHEAYLDLGEFALKRFKREGKKEDVVEAVLYFEKILADEIFCRFDAYDMSMANYHLGVIYLHGNPFVEKDVERAINHLVQARNDLAYLELIGYYANYGDRFLRSIKRCIGLMNDPALKLSKYKEYRIEPPKPVDLISSIQKLLEAKPKKKKHDFASALEQDLLVVSPSVASSTSINTPSSAAKDDTFEKISIEEVEDDDGVVDLIRSDDFVLDDDLFDDQDDFPIPD